MQQANDSWSLNNTGAAYLSVKGECIPVEYFFPCNIMNMETGNFIENFWIANPWRCILFSLFFLLGVWAAGIIE